MQVEGCRVSELAQELHHDELEDDRAGEDSHEDIVPRHALEYVDLFHLPRAYLIKHLEQHISNQNRIEGTSKNVYFIFHKINCAAINLLLSFLS